MIDDNKLHMQLVNRSTLFGTEMSDTRYRANGVKTVYNFSDAVPFFLILLSIAIPLD